MSETKLSVTLIQHTPEPEKLVAAAAKLCYSKAGASEIMEGLTQDATDKFVGMLADVGHASPIEHASFTFAIEGVSRALSHQLVRHRMASFSQKSQRYVNEGQFKYIIPPEIAKQEYLSDEYLKMMDTIEEFYGYAAAELREIHLISGMSQLDAEKKGFEDARYLLPNACETKVVVTMNARGLMNFFQKRCCNRAQWEIRAMANEMLRLVKEIAPTLFKNAGAPCVNGPCPEGVMSCKK